MNNERNDKNIQKRIINTLEITEQRGYNLTIEQLSKYLIGGTTEKSQIEQIIHSMETIETEDGYVATKGHLELEKCRRRAMINPQLKPIYTTIAHEFVSDYIKLCPWVQCILLTGSMATDGLGKNDDIDFNLIVQDGTKYTSYLIAVFTGLKYALKYRKYVNLRYFRILPRIICISVIWEHYQVTPFLRQDEQVGFELLIAKTLFNQDFFSFMINNNCWLKNYFPQLFEQNTQKNLIQTTIMPQSKKIPRVIEWIARHLVFLMYKSVYTCKFHDSWISQRMKYMRQVKHPYGLLDIPQKK